MIRFQICIFDILNTARIGIIIHHRIVVIRFQICIFDILNTAPGHNDRKEHKL